MACGGAARTLAALLLSVAAMTTQAGDRGEWCEEQWRFESAKAAGSSSYGALLAAWQGYAAKCSGTVAYEARLATAYLLAGQVDQAREVLRPLQGAPSRYGHLVELAAIACDQAELARSGATEEDVRRLEARLRRLVEKHPDFADAHGMLGGMQSMLGEHAAAVVSLERGLKSPMNPAGIYRHLTISLAELGRYADSMHAADEAVRHDRALTSDPYFMFAVARANAGLGQLEEAETTLELIAAKKPDVRGDPEFARAVQFVRAKAAGR
jgi:tetratricopeptide (TPR) repeat protein